MPVRLYETLFLLDSTKVSADADAARATLHAILEKHGGEIAGQPAVGREPQAGVPDQEAEEGVLPDRLLPASRAIKQDGIEKDFGWTRSSSGT